MRKLLRKLKLAIWVINGYLGWRIRSIQPQKVTVLLTYFNPARMKDLNSQLRNILKCVFVERIVVSNHNPDLRIEDQVTLRHSRLIFLNQDTKRACGYRWRIASTLSSEYLIVIDDDILLFPSQLKVLFEALLEEPAVPHGFSGMLLSEDGGYQYCEHENMRVQYLCEVYGVTKNHVKRYFEMERLLAEQDASLPGAVDELGDYILISQTADWDPIIHNAGRLFRSDTFKSQGIANHKEEQFLKVLADVSRAVRKVRNLSL